MTDFTTPAVPDVATDPTERAAQVRRALNDPGAIVPRLRIEGGGYELVTDWQVRALAAAGLLAAPAAQPDDEAAILIADLYDIASQVHSENRHDGRTTPGKAWTDAAWLVYQRASDQARAALAALRGKQHG